MQQFTLSQDDAVRHGDGPALVIAGPGSGKTLVTTHRIHNLVSVKSIKPSQILAVSFTDEAAEEMRLRYNKLSGHRQDEVRFGTFHSIFYNMLRRYVGGFSYRPADKYTCLTILKEVFKEHFSSLSLSTDQAVSMLSEISRIKNFVTRGSAHTMKILPYYDEAMHNRGYLDFDDMLIMFLKLIRKDDKVLGDIRASFRYIMVDEFQDINRLQFEIIRLIAAPDNNIFAVGDDDQSIYAFRGSDPGIMLSFRSYYPGALIYLLTDNFRCDKNIASMAFRLIRHNKKRYKKDLISACPGLSKPVIKSFEDEISEAEAVISSIRKHPANQTIGILYRTHRAGTTVVSRLREEGLISGEGISAMTFHSSKGLEFDSVFIVHANEEITPGRHINANILEEERRMFYVAVTRAKQRLHIFNTKTGYNAKNSRSRFVRELY